MSTTPRRPAVAIFLPFVWISFFISLSRSLAKKHPHLDQGAFCQPVNYNSSSDGHFPQTVPPPHIPWIWDALYDPIKSIVEVYAIFTGTCAFDKKKWIKIVDKYPDYRSRLADGDISNILVPVESTRLHNSTLIKDISNGRVTCNYLSADGKILSSKLSNPIPPQKSLGESRFIIHCPAPLPIGPSQQTVAWERMSIERSTESLEGIPGIDTAVKSTAPFHVCHLPREELNPVVQQPMYELSLCTATGRGDRHQLVEWIEHNLAQGVQHLFIYNTISPPSAQRKMQHMLQDYVDEGLVTIIPWPYNNCVLGMASSRPINLPSKDKKFLGGSKVFLPPSPMGQKTAAASCYSRFRHTSKYMLYIDDDEFLVSMEKTIRNYIRDTFEAQPKAPAIMFFPVMMGSCAYPAPNQTILNLIPQLDGVFPRVSRKQIGRAGEHKVGKMVFRTEAVLMFRTHKIGQFENSNWSADDIYFASNKNAVKLHYKSSYQESGDIWGLRVPVRVMHEKRRFCGKGKQPYVIDPHLSLLVHNSTTIEVLADAHKVVDYSFSACRMATTELAAASATDLLGGKVDTALMVKHSKAAGHIQCGSLPQHRLDESVRNIWMERYLKRTAGWKK